MIPETQIKFRRQTERWTNQSIFKSKQGAVQPKFSDYKCLTIKLQFELRTKINQIW